MIRHAPRTVQALVAAIALVPSLAAGQASGTYTLSGDRIAVYNLAGTIDVRGGPGSSVRVDVQAGGSDVSQLSVATGPIAGFETLRVIYPDDDVVYSDSRHGRSRTEIRVRDDGTFFGDRDHGGRRVRITSSGRGLEAYADLTVTVPRGRTVELYLGVGEVSVANVEGDLLVDVASAPVRTQTTKGRLLVDTGSGSVDVVDAEGDVSVDTGSGSVDVTGVQGQSLLVDTGSGSVEARDVTVQDLKIDTGSGRITANRTTMRRGNLDTGSGSVHLELMSDIDDLVVDTGSGSVTVEFPPELGARLDLESSSGGIDFDVPITVTQFNRSSLRGEIGDGRGMIRIDTGSGSIRFIQR
jgi:lia operon protein LiaG